MIPEDEIRLLLEEYKTDPNAVHLNEQGKVDRLEDARFWAHGLAKILAEVINAPGVTLTLAVNDPSLLNTAYGMAIIGHEITCVTDGNK